MEAQREVWEYRFKDGALHTICTLLGIIGKKFPDAGLKDISKGS